MNENNYSVYMHKNTINGKVYIGITCQEPKKRWLYGNGYRQNNYFNNAIKKYGWNQFEHIILETNLTKEQAEKLEIEKIKEYNSTNQIYGYNIQNGGSAYGKHTEETRAKISKSHIGICHTEESKQKISDALRGRKLTDEWLANRTKAQTGLKRTKETCKKISDSVSVPVICINTRIVYKSLTEASLKTNTSIGHISSCCNKKRKSAGTDENGKGLYWMFYDEYIEKKLEHKTNEEIFPKKIKQKNIPVVCVETNKIYSSITKASEDTGILIAYISNCLHGKQKTAGKLHWKYAT